MDKWWTLPQNKPVYCMFFRAQYYILCSSRFKTQTVSTWRVWGNMSKGLTDSILYFENSPFSGAFLSSQSSRTKVSESKPRSLERVCGEHEIYTILSGMEVFIAEISFSSTPWRGGSRISVNFVPPSLSLSITTGSATSHGAQIFRRVR